MKCGSHNRQPPNLDMQMLKIHTKKVLESVCVYEAYILIIIITSCYLVTMLSTRKEGKVKNLTVFINWGYKIVTDL